MTTKTCFAFLMVILLLCVSGCDGVTPAASESPAPSDAMSPPEAAPVGAAVAGIDVNQRITMHSPEGKIDAGFYRKNLADLEQTSIAIVKATALESNPNPELDAEVAITLTTIRIDRVLKSDGKVKEGSDFILVEYYRKIAQNADDKNVIHIDSVDGAMPLRMQRQYLLFMIKSPQNYADYAFAGAWQGKFPLTAETKGKTFPELTAEELEFPVKEKDNEVLWTIAKEAYEKYLK